MKFDYLSFIAGVLAVTAINTYFLIGISKNTWECTVRDTKTGACTNYVYKGN